MGFIVRASWADSLFYGSAASLILRGRTKLIFKSFTAHPKIWGSDFILR
nr:MAG TPA: hypothetical protein [Caudoviricetes sp.]